MKFKILPLAIVCMLSFCLTAASQAPQPANAPDVKLSQSFPEPVDGNVRLLITKAGNTLMFHFMPKDGIQVTVFDNAGNQKATNLITSKKWDADHLERGELGGLHEINGDVVIFLVNAFDKRTLTLFRIIVDQETGKVKQEDKLDATGKFNIVKAYSVALGGLAMPEVKVDKDPESGCYAVSILNTFVSDRDKRLEIIHYDSSHKEINRAHFDSPNGTYKYITRLGTYVHRDKFVFVCAYGYNTVTSGGKSGRIIIARLDNGSKEFVHKFVNVNAGSRKPEAAIQYDAESKTLQLLTLIQTGHVNMHNKMYAATLHFMDPEKLAVKHKHPLKHEFSSSFGKKHLGYIKAYAGIPQNIVLNPDHSITVMSEEMKIGYMEAKKEDTKTKLNESYWTDLGDIGITTYDRLGQETGGFAVSKEQRLPLALEPLYLYKRQRGEWSFRTGSVLFNFNLVNRAFFSYDYVNSGNAEYVIFNDHPKNFDEKNKGPREKRVISVSGTNAVCFRRKDAYLEKFYLFGEPQNNDHSRFVNIESSARNADGKTLATVMVERTGNTKKAYVAWIQFK